MPCLLLDREHVNPLIRLERGLRAVDRGPIALGPIIATLAIWSKRG